MSIGILAALLQATAFVDVNVLPMTGRSAQLLPRQTVVVVDGHITRIGPTGTTAVPAGARIIRGEGRRVLMPGLSDLHTHTLHRDELPLLLSYGITSIRNLHGLRVHLAWRDSIAKGLLAGPRIFSAGPILDGDPPSRATNHIIRTPQQADSAVRAHTQLGFDQIKIYDNITPEVYRALVESTRRHGIPLVGHVPTPVGIDLVLELRGQKSIEHAEEIMPFVRDVADTAQVDALARRMVAAGVAFSPTFSVWLSNLDQARDWTAAWSDPDIQRVHPDVRQMFNWSAGNAPHDNPRAATRIEQILAFIRRVVGQYYKLGGTLVLGTDSPMPLVVPGKFLLREMQAYEQSGLPRYEVLRIATRGAAQFMGASDRIGTIELGKQADLLLLEASPLDNLQNLRTQVGVMVHGHWHDRAKNSGQQ